MRPSKVFRCLLSIFLEEINDYKGYSSIFLPQITVLDNPNVDLEKSWKGPGTVRMKMCGNPVLPKL